MGDQPRGHAGWVVSFTCDWHGPEWHALAAELLTEDAANLVGMAGLGCDPSCSARQSQDDEVVHLAGCLASRIREAVAHG